MYRKQMTWQKILCFAAIAVSAVVFLYALGLMTDLYDSLYYTMMDPNNPADTWVTGSGIGTAIIEDIRLRMILSEGSNRSSLLRFSERIAALFSKT